jgi:hypothetical protein
MISGSDKPNKFWLNAFGDVRLRYKINAWFFIRIIPISLFQIADPMGDEQKLKLLLEICKCICREPY